MIKIISNWGVAGRETTDCVTPPLLSCCLSVLWEKSFYSSTGTPPQRGIICTPMICHTALCVCACVRERAGAVTDTMSESCTQPTGILANMRLLRPRRPTLHAHAHNLYLIIMCLSRYLCLAFNALLSFVFKEHCLIWTTPLPSLYDVHLEPTTFSWPVVATVVIICSHLLSPSTHSE